MSDMVHYICNYYIKGSPAEIEIPTHWDLIGSSTTVLTPMSSPSSILPSPSSYGTFIIYSHKQKNGAFLKHVIISLFYYFDTISSV
jgi:hypothetical protein